MVRKWQSWDLNPGLPVTNSAYPNAGFYCFAGKHNFVGAAKPWGDGTRDGNTVDKNIRGTMVGLTCSSLSDFSCT